MNRNFCLKFTVIFIILCVVSSTISGCDSHYTPPEGMRVAMIATPSDITDRSYNSIVYETCKSFCSENNIPFTYYRAPEATADSYISMMDAAINDDFNIIVLNDSLSARAVRLAANANPEVKFIASDVDASSFGKNYTLPPNLVCWTFKEDYAGYMAGYAAVKEGYRHLGFMGGVSVGPVMRFSSGFIQGADEAAGEIGANVQIEHVYANQFFADADISAYMTNWYMNKEIDVIFACAGMAWVSVADAAQATNGKMIGVDVDQRDVINEYTKQDTVITSAVKGLDISIKTALETILNENWENIGGHSYSLSLTDSDNPENNYLKLPTKNWSMKNFTKSDYQKLVKRLCDGELKVFDETANYEPKYVTVNYHGSIK